MIILLFIFVFGLCWFVSLSCLMVYSLLFCVCVVCDSVLCVFVVVWVSVHLDLCGPCWGLLCGSVVKPSKKKFFLKIFFVLGNSLLGNRFFY